MWGIDPKVIESTKVKLGMKMTMMGLMNTPNRMSTLAPKKMPSSITYVPDVLSVLANTRQKMWGVKCRALESLFVKCRREYRSQMTE